MSGYEWRQEVGRRYLFYIIEEAILKVNQFRGVDTKWLTFSWRYFQTDFLDWIPSWFEFHPSVYLSGPIEFFFTLVQVMVCTELATTRRVICSVMPHLPHRANIGSYNSRYRVLVVEQTSNIYINEWYRGYNGDIIFSPYFNFILAILYWYIIENMELISGISLWTFWIST